MKPLFFKSTEELRNWLAENHLSETELWVGYYKKKSPNYNYSWSETVDEFICFGWIDGLRKSIDEETYMIRITPRKPTSIWSAINIEKVTRLTKLGLMQPAGIKAFELKNKHKSKIYSFEQQKINLSLNFKKLFVQNEVAWGFFNSLPPTTKKQAIWWVMSAKKEETKLRRLAVLIESSKKQEVIPPLNWTKKKDTT